MTFDLEKAREVCKTLPKYMNGACPCKEEAEAAKMLIKALPEIERLRAELASANVELLAAGELVTRLKRVREAEIDHAGAAERIYLEGVRAKDARIQELEDALAEERAKRNVAGHGDCFYRTPSRTDPLVWKCDKGVICDWNCCPIKNEKRTDALQELQAEGKIGPEDATPKIKRCYSCGRPLDEIDCDNFTCCDCAPSWQITEEREEAFGRILRRLEYDQSLPGRTNYKIQRAMELLRAMLEEAGQE